MHSSPSKIGETAVRFGADWNSRGDSLGLPSASTNSAIGADVLIVRGSPAVERRLGGPPAATAYPSLPGDVLGMACLLCGHCIDRIFANVRRLIAHALEKSRDKNQIHVGGDTIDVA